MILDLFAGPGGWDEALRQFAHDQLVVGLEWDAAACRTAVLAGHARIRCDISTYPTGPFVGKVDGLVISAPCQPWSTGGTDGGVKDQGAIYEHVRRVRRHGGWLPYGPAEEWHDPRSPLVLEVLRWALALQPRWIALEQVPDVLPLWRVFASVLAEHGYSTWTGIANAADHGVPQVRRRAILTGRRDGVQVEPPMVTHSRSGGSDLLGDLEPWVSMAEALGWDGAELKRDRGRGMAARHGDRPSRPMSMPAPTITCGSGGTGARMSWTFMAAGVAGQGRPRDPRDPRERPADTITAKATAVWVVDGRTERRVSVQEAALLQSFPADYPWAGTQEKRYEQVGNAIPPLLAAAVVAPMLVRQEVSA